MTEFSPTLSSLVYSTYLGGNNGSNMGCSIAVDSNGDAYVSGWTRATNFPTTDPIQAAKGNGTDGDGYSNLNAFVTVLNPQGSKLLFSTYLGGTNDDLGYGIALDPNNNVYVTGVAESTTSPYPPNGASSSTPTSRLIWKSR